MKLLMHGHNDYPHRHGFVSCKNILYNRNRISTTTTALARRLCESVSQSVSHNRYIYILHSTDKQTECRYLDNRNMKIVLLAIFSWSLASCLDISPYPKVEKCLLQYKVIDRYTYL